MRNKFPFAILFLIVLSTFSMLAPQVKAQEQTPTMLVYPSESRATVGETFTIDVNIESVEDLCAWQFNLSWNPTILSFIRCSWGYFLNKPFLFQARPKIHDSSVNVMNPSSAYDDNNATYASFKYNVDGNFSLLSFSTPEYWDYRIDWVDFKMRFEAEGGGTTDDQYRIVYTVSPNTTKMVLRDWTPAASPLDTYVWADQLEPNDGKWDEKFDPTCGDFVWSWDDVKNINLTVETRVVGEPDNKEFRLHEAWVTIQYYRATFGAWRVEPNYIFIGESCLGHVDGFGGSETLATIELEVLETGECSLPLLRTKLIDHYGNRIEHNVRGGYFSSTQVIPATIDIDPDTLNLKSDGEWITAYIELSEGYNVSDIDVSSVLLNDTIGVDLDAPTEIGDYDNDTIPDLMVKFDRAEVISVIYDVLEDTGWRFTSVTLTVTGEVAGEDFAGSDTIKVIVGDLNLDNKVDVEDLVIVALAWGSKPEDSNWNPIADIKADSFIDVQDLIVVGKYYGKY